MTANLFLMNKIRDERSHKSNLEFCTITDNNEKAILIAFSNGKKIGQKTVNKSELEFDKHYNSDIDNVTYQKVWENN